MNNLGNCSNCNVGFYGVEASFSHEALLSYFGKQVNALSCNEFKDVFDDLEEGKIEYGVVPIENSSTGGILEVYDLLRNYGFYIVGEKCVKINHNLLGVKDTKLSDIKQVYSHSQAFLQSKEFLMEHKDWSMIPYFSTAMSAKYISESKLKSKVCIASKKAAELYGLSILKENINYNKNNYTRFIIIGKNKNVNRELDKISIVITVNHKVGSLYDILSYFKSNNLNMAKIESRPIINEPWKYFFYIDFCGNILDENTKRALDGIKSDCQYFRFIGNYKTDCEL